MEDSPSVSIYHHNNDKPNRRHVWCQASALPSNRIALYSAWNTAHHGSIEEVALGACHSGRIPGPYMFIVLENKILERSFSGMVLITLPSLLVVFVDVTVLTETT